MAKVGFDEVLRLLRGSNAWQQAADEDEKAMAIACTVIETYGDLTPDEWTKFRQDGKIWRDHCAYQGALAGLRMANSGRTS
jgi:hypothetical protein